MTPLTDTEQTHLDELLKKILLPLDQHSTKPTTP